jgi:N-acetylglucosaminyldiphosphoundecaprenol N-acetyl-beta-D-mannosaminyltransferase
MSASRTVLGCPVHLLDRDAFLASLPVLAGGDRLIDIVTLNPEQIMAARRDNAVAALIERADIRTVDGIGLALALRLQRAKPVERITGVDLLEALTKRGIPMYLLGGSPGAAEESAKRMNARYQGTQIVGAWSGGTPLETDDEPTLARIAASAATALAVAYGAPVQTAWIERNRSSLQAAGIRIAIGVGGALDYQAGYARRAPKIVRRLGLEWLFRLAAEPWRWRRQLVLPEFAALAMAEAVRIRLGRA